MLPKNLRYDNKVEAAMARSYTSNIQPNGALNGYTPGSVTTINIPTGPNLALVGPESVLKFTVKGSANAVGRLDSCGAHGYIQRLRIFHGSNLIEDTDEYGLLAKIYFDLQVSTDASYGKYAILAGTRGDMYGTLATDIGDGNGGVGGQLAGGADAAAIVASVNAMKTSLNRGVKTHNRNNGKKIVADVDNTYTITLLSLLGSLSSANYIPLFACTSAPIRLEIQWAKSIFGVGAFPNNAEPFVIDKIEYIASYLELSDSAMSIINSGRNGPLSFTLQGVRNYSTTKELANGAQTQVNFGIPAKFGSVKNILTTVRDSAKSNLAMYYPFSSVKLGLQNYYFKIGSKSSIPAIAPDCDAQFFAEVLKAVGSISDLNHHPSIDLESYTLNVPEINNANQLLDGSKTSGCFYTGLDLENYAESDKSTIYTGYNTKNDDIYHVMNFIAPEAIASARFDAFVMFDQELVFENGTCYVSF